MVPEQARVEIVEVRRDIERPRKGDGAGPDQLRAFATGALGGRVLGSRRDRPEDAFADDRLAEEEEAWGYPIG